MISEYNASVKKFLKSLFLTMQDFEFKEILLSKEDSFHSKMNKIRDEEKKFDKISTRLYIGLFFI